MPFTSALKAQPICCDIAMFIDVIEYGYKACLLVYIIAHFLVNDDSAFAQNYKPARMQQVLNLFIRHAGLFIGATFDVLCTIVVHRKIWRRIIECVVDQFLLCACLHLSWCMNPFVPLKLTQLGGLVGKVDTLFHAGDFCEKFLVSGANAGYLSLCPSPYVQVLMVTSVSETDISSCVNCTVEKFFQKILEFERIFRFDLAENLRSVMQLPTNMDFMGGMRLRVYAFEEMVSINALQSTFGQSSRNASPTCVEDKLTSEEIERKADMQIANVLNIGKVARQLAYKVIAESVKHSEKVDSVNMPDEKMHDEKIYDEMHDEKMHDEKMHEMHDEKMHDEQDIYDAAYMMQSLSKGL